MRFLLVPILLAAALLAPACSKRQTPVAEGLASKTLHLGNNAEPRDLDPHVVVAYSDYNVLMALFEGLTVLDEASGKPLPAMAKSWDVSDDGLQYTFHLRETAVWSTGDPVTAEDFAFSIRRILTPAMASEYSYMLYPLKGAEAFNLGRTDAFSTVGVEVLDARTLRLTLDRPTPYFLALTGHQAWFPVHRPSIEKYGDPLQRTTRWTQPERFVGNGAFLLETWAPDQRIVVKKNPRYWDAASNALERVVFYPIANPKTEEANFRAGQLHVTYEVLPDRIDTYRRDHPEQIRVDPLLESFFLRFNTTRAPFTDQRVRRALALAIDREAIAGSVMRGKVMPAYSLVPDDTGGYHSTARTPTDFEAARQLLAEAGFPNGAGFPKVEIQMNGDPINTAIHEAIQAMWRRELNIEVGLAQLEFRVYLDNQHTLNYDITRSRWVSDYNDPASFTDLFTSTSGNNDTGWKNPEYDRLLDAASRERDPARRFAHLQQAEALLLEEAPLAPVFFGTRTYLIHPQVKGWVPSLLGIRRYQTIRLE